MRIIAGNGYGRHVHLWAPEIPRNERESRFYRMAIKREEPWRLCSSCHEMTRSYARDQGQSLSHEDFRELVMKPFWEKSRAAGSSKAGMTTIPAPPPPLIDKWPSLPSQPDEAAPNAAIVSSPEVPLLADEDQEPLEGPSFTHPFSLFSLRLPRGWRAMQPVSQDAAFAAASSDGHVLLEVMFADTSAQRNGLEALAALPDILVEATRAEHPDVREVWRGEMEMGTSLTAVRRRLIIEYIDRVNPIVYDGSTLFTTDYFFLGSEERILFANFKVPSFEYRNLAPLFERIVRGIAIPEDA